MRVSELTDLKRSNVFFNDELVPVFGKGSKERLVPIGKPALQWIQKYQTEVRGKLAGTHATNNAVFLQLARQIDVTRSDLEHRERIHPPRTHLKRSTSTHLPPFVCYASPRRRRQPSRRSGNARPCRHFNDANLYPYRPGVCKSRTQEISSESIKEVAHAKPQSRKFISEEILAL